MAKVIGQLGYYNEPFWVGHMAENENDRIYYPFDGKHNNNMNSIL